MHILFSDSSSPDVGLSASPLRERIRDSVPPPPALHLLHEMDEDKSSTGDFRALASALDLDPNKLPQW